MIEVKGREIVIPREEFNIGTTYDARSEMRHFHMRRVRQGGIDLAGLVFNLDLEYANGKTDTATLTKDVTDRDIDLMLTIEPTMLQVPGTVIIQIRALAEDGTVKWSSYKGAFFVEDCINTPAQYEGKITQLEQYEAEWGSVRDNVRALNSRMDEIVKMADGIAASDVEKEVADARVGADGKKYESAGSAVREQITAEKDKRTAADASLNDAIANLSVFVTPQMFGAKGDAYRYSGGYWRNKNDDIATDDTDAFLDALTFAKRRRVSLYIPAGKYRLTKQLVIDFNGASLIGESEYNTVLCPESTFNGTSVIIINPNYTISALQNACIKNLTFDFEAISLRGIEFGYLIYGCEFKNLYFQKCTKSGLCALNGKDASEQIIFDNIQLHTFGNKLVEPLVSFSRLHESILRTCRFFGTKKQEVTQEYPLVYMDMPQGVSFISCDFFYQTGSSCIKAESTTQSTVQGVFIYGCSFENNQGSYIVEIEGQSAADKYATSFSFGSNRINGGNYTLRLKNISASSVTDSWAKLVLEGNIYHSYLIGRVDRDNSASFIDSVAIELSDNAAKIINSIVFQSDARKITLSKDGLSIVQDGIFTRFVTYAGLASIENNGGRTLFNENGIYLHRLQELPSTASAYANQLIIVNSGEKDILYVSMQIAKDIWNWIPLNS